MKRQRQREERDKRSAVLRYTELLAPRTVREDELLRVSRRHPEIEIQARWFAGEFGRDFVTTDGEPVQIVQFGVWNREAGPDFAEAAIRLGEKTRKGSIELDTDPRDWEAHGHSTNPDYETVILHVCCSASAKTFFTRTARNRLVPQIVLNLSQIEDPPPYELPSARPGRCVAPLRDLGESKALEIIEAAARYRLQRKSARLRRMAETCGRDEALYQALAAALGYKHNKLPFTLLAQRLPLRVLKSGPADALLFGVAGFLRETDLSPLTRDTRAYLRKQWDDWWPQRAAFERLVLPSRLWRLGGSRPVNHPQRRLAALAHFVRHWPTVRRFSAKPEPAAFRRFCASLRDDYWEHHYTVRSASSAKPMALVGASRATEILSNVLFPLAFADDPGCWDAYRSLPATLSNRPVAIAATRLFGSLPPRSILDRAMYQQGLLQIYEDFCLRDASDCSRCPFPRQIERW